MIKPSCRVTDLQTADQRGSAQYGSRTSQITKNAKRKETDLRPKNESAQPVWGALLENGFVESTDRETKDDDFVSKAISSNFTTAETV
jgi:hypothetical protein